MSDQPTAEPVGPAAKVKCVECQHWRLKGSPLAQNGFGICAMQASGATYYASTFLRNCSAFSRAGVDIVFGRHAWLRRVDELIKKGGPDAAP